jgi:hypothetical protein
LCLSKAANCQTAKKYKGLFIYHYFAPQIN